MELISQDSDYSPYVTAPTSPNGFSPSNSVQFYSAPTSPSKKSENDAFGVSKGSDFAGSNMDDFEFETSRKFREWGQKFEPLGRNKEQQVKKHRERGDSLPAMAFADELFLNGLVMPLKLPPRLQYDNESSNSFSQMSSPRSPFTVCKLPFGRWNARNDDFDPFMVALQKVREENRGRSSGKHVKRARSLSPFRKTKSSDYTNGWSQFSPVPDSRPNHLIPMESRGSAYARWVRDQIEQAGLSPKTPNGLKGSFLRRRIRPLKIDHKRLNKPECIGEYGKGYGGLGSFEKKMQKIKGLLLRYASFGKENSESKQRHQPSGKPSYFRRLSFKFKGNAPSNGKKRAPADSNKTAV